MSKQTLSSNPVAGQWPNLSGGGISLFLLGVQHLLGQLYEIVKVDFVVTVLNIFEVILHTRDGTDSHDSHLNCLPVHLFTALTVFLVSVSRRCHAATFLAKGDNRVGLR